MIKRNENLGAFMLSFGICAALAGIGLIIFSNWQGMFGLLSGLYLSYYGFKQLGENSNR